MKKSIIISLSLLMSLSAFAGYPSRERSEIPKSNNYAKHEILRDITVNGRTFHVVAPPDLHKSIATRAESEAPITSAPGTLHYYCKDVVGYGEGMPIQAYAIASYINWDGDDAYIRDIVTGAPMGTYVTASRHDGLLELPMGQTVLEFDDEDYNMEMGLMKPIFTIDSDSEGDNEIFVWFEYSDDYDSMFYTIEPNGSMILESPPAKYPLDEFDPQEYGFPYYVIGYYYSDDHVWSGYCDVFQAFDEFNYELVELPENLEMQTFSYINMFGNGVIVSAGETGNSLYIQGLSEFAPDAVFKADIIENGTKIAVAPNQFIGIEADMYFVITSTVYQNEDGELEVAEGNQPVYFNIERDSGTGKILSITSDEESTYYLSFNDDPFYFYPMDLFMDLKLKAQDEFKGVPSTPHGLEYYNYADWLGANFVFFKLSSFANNGDIIDVNKLYYRVYIDGEPYEFEEQVSQMLDGEEAVLYYGIKEPTTLVPYTFNNSRDLYEDSGGTFIVALYLEGIETVGIQAVYMWGDETTTSPIVTVNTETGEITTEGGSDAGIDSIEAAEVVATDYLNLNGLKISNPEKGIYLKVSKLSNGKTIVNKIAK